ncbi:hypothetical protein GWI33_004643 [Rhynchophorus ferrugineus]|uniref:Uncharacterized protein n=1 Tax=Rhynchophorus ferrugineus TaxID=354439 RepID=A0A834MP25_RHYFE|nr:hypothetical protein GWI33_004643 [Rhynchophorus ferrugineus]
MSDHADLSETSCPEFGNEVKKRDKTVEEEVIQMLYENTRSQGDMVNPILHLQYSPDIAPSDCPLFPVILISFTTLLHKNKMKIELAGLVAQ